MKKHALHKLSGIVLALLVLTPVIGAAPDRLGAYDFSYQASGDVKVRPVQVFDNGRYTYFQFRAGEPIPAIFADAQGGPVFLIPENEGPYVKVATVSGGFSLRMGLGSGRVAYQGPGRMSSLQADPVSAPTQRSTIGRLDGAARMVTASYKTSDSQVASSDIAKELNSYATPLKGDRVEWKESGKTSKDYAIAFTKGQSKVLPASVKALLAVLPVEQNTSQYEIVGRDDDTYKEGLPEARSMAIADLLAAHGIPREKIKLKSGVPVQSESNSKLVTGVTLRWIAEAPAPVRTEQDPDQAILARLMSRKITTQQAMSEWSALRLARDTSSQRPIAQVAPSSWQILKSDSTLEAMLNRWAGLGGWTVQWKDAPDVRIMADSKLDRPDFLSAADYVIAQAKTAGYRIKAAAYSNKVLVISEERLK